MPIDNDPSSYSLLEYTGVIGLAVWGGAVNYWRRLRTGQIPLFSVMELVGEVATSGFVGVLAFWICEANDVAPLITAATVGVAGHVGGRTLVLLERHLLKRFP